MKSLIHAVGSRGRLPQKYRQCQPSLIRRKIRTRFIIARPRVSNILVCAFGTDPSSRTGFATGQVGKWLTSRLQVTCLLAVAAAAGFSFAKISKCEDNKYLSLKLFNEISLLLETWLLLSVFFSLFPSHVMHYALCLYIKLCSFFKTSGRSGVRTVANFTSRGATCELTSQSPKKLLKIV